MDDSGLFYRKIPYLLYPSASEARSTGRGTEQGKHRQRVTFAMCCKAYGSIVLPVLYVQHFK